VHAYDFAFAKGSDFDFVLIAAGLWITRWRRCRAGGCILFCSVVALEDLSGVAVMQGCGGGSRDVEKQIYAGPKSLRRTPGRCRGFQPTLDAIYFSVPIRWCRRPYSCRLWCKVSIWLTTQWGVVKSITTSTSRSFSAVRAAPFSFSVDPAYGRGGRAGGRLPHQRSCLPRPNNRMFIASNIVTAGSV